LGYGGEDCTTVYSKFLAQFPICSLAHSASQLWLGVIPARLSPPLTM
jgi:hypothetical protein